MINVLLVCWVISTCITIACHICEIYEYKKHEKHDEDRRHEK